MEVKFALRSGLLNAQEHLSAVALLAQQNTDVLNQHESRFGQLVEALECTSNQRGSVIPQARLGEASKNCFRLKSHHERLVRFNVGMDETGREAQGGCLLPSVPLARFGSRCPSQPSPLFYRTHNQEPLKQYWQLFRPAPILA